MIILKIAITLKVMLLASQVYSLGKALLAIKILLKRHGMFLFIFLYYRT